MALEDLVKGCGLRVKWIRSDDSAKLDFATTIVNTKEKSWRKLSETMLAAAMYFPHKHWSKIKVNKLEFEVAGREHSKFIGNGNWMGNVHH